MGKGKPPPRVAWCRAKRLPLALGVVFPFVVLALYLEWSLESDLNPLQRDWHQLPCPNIHAQGARERPVPTLSGPLREVLLGRVEKVRDTFRNLYRARDEIRKRVGNLFWMDRGAGCELHVTSLDIARSLFSNDGVDLLRPDMYQGVYKAMKFADGDTWLRQRKLLTAHVLTPQIKQQRAERIAPKTAECIKQRLAKGIGGIVDIVPMVRECLALFFVQAVMGEVWPGRSALVKKLLACKARACDSEDAAWFPWTQVQDVPDDAFVCLHEEVLHEVHRRLNQYIGSNKPVDPDRESLLSRMLRWTPAADGNISNGQFLDVVEVIPNVISFMAAGWETSTPTLINAMWFLSAWESFPHSRQLQDRLGSSSATVRQMLVNRVVSETLRWTPPIPWHSGLTARELQVDEGHQKYLIPKGTSVIVDILGTHNASSSGPLGVGWDPEHATQQHYAGGVGARHCPGGKMALLALEHVLGSLLAEFRFQVAHPQIVETWFDGITGELGHDLCVIPWRAPLDVLVTKVTAINKTA